MSGVTGSMDRPSVQPLSRPFHPSAKVWPMHPRTAFGITAAIRPDSARLGSEVEALGYDELWVNDTRRGDGLATLAPIAAATSRLRLAVGVVALSEQTPTVIAERVDRASIPVKRLAVGVGSGASRSLDLVRMGVAELRNLLPDHEIAVAAVGPRMARLGGEIADAVVANWALPDRLADLRELISRGATEVGRPEPRLVAYVRATLGPGAVARLREEMDRYAGHAPHYARAFAEQPDGPIGIAVESGDATEVAAALGRYRSVVDTVVVRGIPATDTVDAWLEIARAADPSLGWG
jgi:alkanesulfonate monooxygenase SsuD/methylene tetrahydromethanopterin reductase-like flavin-dependent oxidoreductase (luciferase family)